MPALVSALNSVDLPTFGRPTIPQRTVIAVSWCATTSSPFPCRLGQSRATRRAHGRAHLRSPRVLPATAVSARNRRRLARAAPNRADDRSRDAAARSRPTRAVSGYREGRYGPPRRRPVSTWPRPAEDRAHHERSTTPQETLR